MIKTTIFCITCLTILINGTYTTALGSQTGYQPTEGFVPNDTVAIKIAEAVWQSIYGESIVQFKPFKATLDQNGELWIVTGTLHQKKGGVPVAKIQKKDGKIVFVFHGK